MSGPFLAGLAWLSFAAALCLLSAYGLKRTATNLLVRAFGPSFGLGLYALLTLPGFFLHEGAHALAALILHVPLRGVTLIPRHAADELSVGAGVRVAPVDPLRMALIALAPLLAGMVSLGLLSGTLGTAGADPRPWMRLPEWVSQWDRTGAGLWAMLYLLWSVGSHMAPSRGDWLYVQRGGLVLLAVLVLLGLLLSLLGAAAASGTGAVLSRLGDGLAIGAILNTILLLPLAIAARIIRRRTRS